MGHLVLQVLPEPEPVGIDAQAQKELFRRTHEVGEHAVRDYALFHRLSDSLHHSIGSGVGYKYELLVLYLGEPGPALVVRVDEKLHLHHVELPHPYHSLAGGDLVSVPPAGLYDAERQLLPVVAVKVLEVDEYPLGSLRPEISHARGAGPYGRLEHEVELFHLAEVTSALRAFDAEFGESALELRRTHGVRVLAEILHQMVGPERKLALCAVCHVVREFVHMSRGLEHFRGVDGLGIYLHKTFPSLVNVSPYLEYVVLHRASERSVVEHSGHAAVKLEGRPDEASAFADGHKLVSVCLFIH